jgi:hypothetical protein
MPSNRLSSWQLFQSPYRRDTRTRQTHDQLCNRESVPQVDSLDEWANVSALYAARIGTTDILNAFPEVASVNVPTGSYLIKFHAEAFANDSDSQNFTCVLNTGARQEINIGGYTDPANTLPIMIQDVATLSSPTRLTVSCGGFRVQLISGTLLPCRLRNLLALRLKALPEHYARSDGPRFVDSAEVVSVLPLALNAVLRSGAGPIHCAVAMHLD